VVCLQVRDLPIDFLRLNSAGSHSFGLTTSAVWRAEKCSRRSGPGRLAYELARRESALQTAALEQAAE
jgi:hypothetical protein